MLSQGSSFALDYSERLEKKENFSNFLNKLNERKKLISEATVQKKNSRKFINSVLKKYQDIANVTDLPGDLMMEITLRVAQYVQKTCPPTPGLPLLTQEQLMVDTNISRIEDHDLLDQIKIRPPYLKHERRKMGQALVQTPHFSLKK